MFKLRRPRIAALAAVVFTWGYIVTIQLLHVISATPTDHERLPTKVRSREAIETSDQPKDPEQWAERMNGNVQRSLSPLLWKPNSESDWRSKTITYYNSPFRRLRGSNEKKKKNKSSKSSSSTSFQNNGNTEGCIDKKRKSNKQSKSSKNIVDCTVTVTSNSRATPAPTSRPAASSGSSGETTTPPTPGPRTPVPTTTNSESSGVSLAPILTPAPVAPPTSSPFTSPTSLPTEDGLSEPTPTPRTPLPTVTSVPTNSPSLTSLPSTIPASKTECCNEASISFDPAGNPYGTFMGFDFESEHSIEITYSTSGVKARYPELECGHDSPIMPSIIEPQLLMWMEVIDFNNGNCEPEGNVTLSFQGGAGERLTSGLWLWEWTNFDSNPGEAELTFICPDPVPCSPEPSETQLDALSRTDSPPLSDGIQIISNQLFNTGVDDNGSVLAIGEDDPHYYIEETQIQAKVISGKIDVRVQETESMWIWEKEETGENTTLTFVTTFDLTGCDPATVTLNLDVSFDNFLVVTLNDIIKADIDDGEFALLEIDSGFVPSVNTLRFMVTSTTTGTGLRVENINLYAKRRDNIFILS
ncbi:hypothetical protein IV203_002042 [Nitzschia inconspicua]|uniref:Uncharacterized protein n=1 Tax=Nitzschia inconspicua TaxID=303405 RepID=A0A9K3L8T0_9STRA|nr:hypothetical protein IV203_002042 [Nitzschia inconspicua]